MIIDAFEIYGHDPTDKLDNLWLYQNEMMRIKTAEDQVLLITLDDVIDNMLTMYENHNSIAAERKATYTGGPVPMEFYISQGPFLIPGDPGTGIDPVPPYIETTPKPEEPDEEENVTVPYILDGCLFMYPPNYGSIAGKSYLDPVELHDDRFTCNAAGGSKGLYWYPQWMGAMPHHPYPTLNDDKGAFEPPGAFYPHQNYDMNEDDSDN
ncbi:unnamed protein product, partial [Brenthis ino]